MFGLLQAAAIWYQEHGPRSELQEIYSLIVTSRRMQKESSTGIYDMTHLLMRQCQVYSCGEYHGAVEIIEEHEKGRLTVARSPFKTGRVILGCKAFAMAFPRPKSSSIFGPEKGDQQNDSNEEVSEDDYIKQNFVRLAVTIADMMVSNSELAHAVYELGSTGTDSNNDVSGSESTTSFERLHRIVLQNGIVSASNPDPRKPPSPAEVDDRVSRNTCGLWLLPSYLNHSCVDTNAEVQRFGDLTIVRASRDISPGEEILVSYMHKSRVELECTSSVVEELKERESLLCKCRLCKLVKQEPANVKQRRYELLEAAKISQDEDLEDIEIELEALRANNTDLNFPIFSLCRKIASYYSSCQIGMYKKAAIYFEKAYNLTHFSGLSRQRIRLAMEICMCYLQAMDNEKSKEWAYKLRDDLKTTYGSNVEMLVPIIANTENMTIDVNTMSNLIWNISTPDTDDDYY
ncbi:uncharacterized protein LOC110842314 isoform X2 [Folsomia candida]|nr:uncharacterized protein LOC110842314 isoform X2 [Folsomia candida]